MTEVKHLKLNLPEGAVRQFCHQVIQVIEKNASAHTVQSFSINIYGFSTFVKGLKTLLVTFSKFAHIREIPHNKRTKTQLIFSFLINYVNAANCFAFRFRRFKSLATEQSRLGRICLWALEFSCN